MSAKRFENVVLAWVIQVSRFICHIHDYTEIV